jgi:hypothetical protein
MTQIHPWMCLPGAQFELQCERCVPKVLKLSSEVSESKPLVAGSKTTTSEEVVAGQVWTFDQLQARANPRPLSGST